MRPILAHGQGLFKVLLMTTSSHGALRAHKLHGLGNDFVVLPRWALGGSGLPALEPALEPGLEPGLVQAPKDASAWARALCDRRRGLGADGVLLWQREAQGVRMIILNQDGSRPEMCGNGVRCLVAWLHRAGHLTSQQVTILSDAGPRRCRVERVPDADDPDYQIAVDMGHPKDIPMSAPMRLGPRELPWVGVDMGNPHAVFFVAAMPSLQELDELGQRCHGPSPHPDFARGVNLELALQVAPDRFEVLVYERGVGRTQACGTGACAVAWAAWRGGLTPTTSPITVLLPGGPLVLSLAGQDGPLWMSGPARHVYEAQTDWASMSPPSAQGAHDV